MMFLKKNLLTQIKTKMKKTIYFSVAVMLVFLTVSSAFAELPTYNLTVKNWTLNSPADNELEFDIILENTSAATFEYASGQYFFSFNNLIASGNDDLEYSIVPESSQLPPNMVPRILTNGIGTYNDNQSSNQPTNILRLAFNTIPGCGKGYSIPTGFPGIRIVRMKLKRLSGQFNNEPLNLEWRNPPTVAFATKIFAYIKEGKNCTNTDITTPNTHTIEPFGILPVELASFNSSVNRNTVHLYWATTKEINNSGFDVERNILNTNDWIKAGSVTGKGTTNEPRNYSFSENVNTGKYNYRLKQIDYNGNFEYFNLSNSIEVGIPEKYDISQNYPNPFNPTTKIDYDLPYDGKVNIAVYDLSGRELANLVNEVKAAGYYSLEFNASNLASGIYFYKITSKNFTATKKMVVLK